MATKIKNALISVFYKDQLEPIVKELDKLGVNLISTGGTYDFIKKLGVNVQTVESLTTYPSILGGRVKTLHPKIFGGILGRRDNAQDNEQMKLMLSQLDTQDRALTSLFAGTTVRDTTEEVFIINPDQEIKELPLFRFSKLLGLLDADDLGGSPYYLQVQNLTQLPVKDEEADKKKKKAENGLYYNVPGKLRSTIYDGNKAVSQEEFPASQFGNVELLSGDLFNKHYGTRLWLNPVTGGIDRLEAEQPK